MLWDKTSNKNIPIYDPVLPNHEYLSSLDMQRALYFAFTDSLWGWCNISLILQELKMNYVDVFGGIKWSFVGCFIPPKLSL